MPKGTKKYINIPRSYKQVVCQQEANIVKIKFFKNKINPERKDDCIELIYDLKLDDADFYRTSSASYCRPITNIKKIEGDGTPSEKRGGSPSGLKRLIYDEPSLTITGSATSEFIHPTQNRMLTVRECARIQTFPDYFRFFGSDSQQMQQIGNAIPPLFANQMAAQIFKCDQKASKSFPQGLMWYNVTKSSAMSPALAATCHKLDRMLVNNQLLF